MISTRFLRRTLSGCLFLLCGLAALPGQVTQKKPLPELPVPVSGEVQNLTLDLTEYFEFQGLSGGTLVQMVTDGGVIHLELFNQATPNTVANFLTYVNSGRYANGMIHRNVKNFVVQGGGFFIRVEGEQAFIDQVQTNAAITNEYQSSHPNVRGTISMARLGNQPNSATSQWFINMVDNTTVLGSGSSDGFPYTAFGKVVGRGMEAADRINQATNVNLSESLGGTFGEVPVFGWDGRAPITLGNLILTPEVRVVTPYPVGENPGLLSFFASDITKPDRVDAVVAGSTLQLQVNPGTADTITVTLLVAESGYELDNPQTFPLVLKISGVLDQATQFPDSWRYLPWFGLFRAYPSGWIYHNELGWLFTSETNAAGGLRLYYPGIGWLWTQENVFPHLWWKDGNGGQGTWLTWKAGSTNPNYFYVWSGPQTGWRSPPLQ